MIPQSQSHTTLPTKFIHKNAQQWVAVNQNKQHGLIKKNYKNKQHAWKAPVLWSIGLESQWQLKTLIIQIWKNILKPLV